jgi:FkbM family methyltransferase
MQTWRVRVRGGSTICVPASPRYMTTYVLLEQEDWFEKEIAFVRRVIQPGMRAVDVGANFGIYTSALARGVGSAGRVWALEPASTTLDCLTETISLNCFSQVDVVRLALSNRCGTARLGIDRNSELNSLTVKADQPTEEVPLATLDSFVSAADVRNIDFLKLDAEGEELNILAAGQDFMHGESPLVMFEAKAGAERNAELPAAFRKMGYAIYRLVGPDCVLIPHTERETLDPFELNLFACQEERASQLAARGLLVRAFEGNTSPKPGGGVALCAAQAFWPELSVALSEAPTSYAHAMDAYALWRDESASWEARTTALRGALAKVCAAAQESPSNAVLSSAARIADEAGARQLSVQLLQELLSRLQRNAAPEHPCWPAHRRYDHVAVAGDVRGWFLAAAIEAYVTRVSFSGYFSRNLCAPMLAWLENTPYDSPAMERRRQLIAVLSGQQPHLCASPLLREASVDHLNPEVWNARDSQN